MTHPDNGILRRHTDEAGEALEEAQRAKTKAKETERFAIKTRAELKQATYELAALMEEYAQKLREAADRDNGTETEEGAGQAN